VVLELVNLLVNLLAGQRFLEEWQLEEVVALVLVLVGEPVGLTMEFDVLLLYQVFLF
jgi:hypothetical protein